MTENNGVLHTCECGAKLRIPGQMAGKTGVCPICGAKFEIQAGRLELKEPPAFELDPIEQPQGAENRQDDEPAIDWEDDDPKIELSLEAQSTTLSMENDTPAVGGPARPSESLRQDHPGFAPKPGGAKLDDKGGGHARHWDSRAKSRALWIAPIIIICAVSAVALLYGIVRYAEMKSQDRSFAALMKSVSSTTNLEEQERYLREFIQKNPEHKYFIEIAKKAAEVNKALASRDYHTIMDRFETAKVDLREKISTLTSYLEKYPRGPYAEAVKGQINDIRAELNEREYKRAQAEFEYYRNQPVQAELALKRYLQENPKGKWADKARDQLADTASLWEDADFKEASQRIKKIGDQYEKAVETARDFLAKYPNGKRAEEMNDLLAKYAAKIDDRDYRKALQARALPASMQEKEYRVYLAAHPQGERARAIEALLGSMSGRTENGEAALWQKALSESESTRDPGKALGVIEYYLRSYPNGAYAREARTRIIGLEMKRYTLLAPFPERKAIHVVSVKGKGTSSSYELRGNVRRMDDGRYQLQDELGDVYYLEASDVLSVRPSKEAEYNEFLRQKQPRGAEDFEAMTAWSEKEGFPEKAVINLAMAAYLNPSDGDLVRRLESSGFYFENGRWKCKCSYW